MEIIAMSLDVFLSWVFVLGMAFALSVFLIAQGLNKLFEISKERHNRKKRMTILKYFDNDTEKAAQLIIELGFDD